MSVITESSVKTETRVHIRWMIRRDMPEVLHIEQAAFDRPWTEEDFLKALRQRNCIGMVAEHGDRIVGFMVYELLRGKINLIDLAVHPEFRRRGVGRQMVAKLVGKLSVRLRTRVIGCVRESSLDAQVWLRACGFLAIDILREHYPDTGEDGYAMKYRLTTTDDKSTNQSMTTIH